MKTENCILYTLNDDTTYYFTCIRKVKDGLVRLLKKDSSTKGINVVIDENNEPIIVEEDVILEDILNSLASISKRIDDIQLALIKNDDVDTSSNLDISKIDF